MSATTTTRRQPQPTTTATKRRTLEPERAARMGRIGGNTTAARHSAYEMTRPMMEGLAASWLRKADPEGVLSESERARRAEALKRAHYARMSLARWGKSA